MTSTSDSPCPVCAGRQTTPFFELKQVPVFCNVLWPTRESALNAQRGDITLTLCRKCGHIFNSRFRPEAIAYGQNYENSLHHSAVFQAYASELVDRLLRQYDLRNKKIVEIGAGQGDFLEMLCTRGGNSGAGFDPSFVPRAELPSYVEMIPAVYSEAFAGYPADFIACRHVLEHIERPDAFLRMVRRIAGRREETVTFFEVPNALWTIREQGIWDIIYEHCGYFTPASLAYAFRQSGFEVVHQAAVFGGQFLTIEGVPASGPVPHPAEHAAGAASLVGDTAAFSLRYREKVGEWTARFAAMRASGRKGVIWGAGSKGVTFLNMVPAGGVVDYAIDINPRKRGMYTAGTGQQIVSPDFLHGIQPDVVIVMNRNYFEEIGRQLREMGLSSTLLLA